jgi:hypothetical protein
MILSVGARLFRRQMPPWSEELIYDHQRVRTTCHKIFSRRRMAVSTVRQYLGPIVA